MKRSSGILLWKKENDKYYVLLTHFGGPYWEGIDKGAWSIQKGTVEQGEKIIDTAKRESFEETNLYIENDIKYLATKKVSRKKLVTMFESYFDGSIDNFKSNTFELEWPINSGIINEYSEMDKIKWFSIKEAKEYIHSSQLFFMSRLEDKIKQEEM